MRPNPRGQVSAHTHAEGFVPGSNDISVRLTYEEFKMWVERTPLVMDYIESILPYNGMYVCMYVCIYVCMYAYMLVFHYHFGNMHVCMYVCM